MLSTMRHKWIDMRLRHKLLLTYLLIGSLAALVSAAFISWGAWNSVRERAEIDALTRAHVIAENSAAGLAFRDADAVADTLNVLRIDKRVRYAAVFDGRGQSFVAIGHADPVTVPGEVASGDWVQRSGDYLDIWAPIRIDRKYFGALIVREDMRGIYQRVASLVGVVLLGLLLAGVMGWLVILRVLPRVLRPLNDLTSLMQQMTQQGNYSYRARTHAHDEVGDLAQSFNRMLDQIECNNQALSDELRQRREVESKLDQLAHYDNVTRLTNRHYFEHRLRGLLLDIRQQGRKVALMFIDLDNFKDVNDTYGHHVGDVLLRSVAERMRNALRAEDEISRLGGDEFALLMTHAGDPPQVELTAQKILKALAQPVHIDGRDIFVGCSIGSVLLPEDTDDFSSALRYADMAMYHAKHLGKNNHQMFKQALLDEHGQRLVLEAELRHALDEGALEMYFQPISKLNDNHVLLGAEALIRWRHPERGLIPPGEFIPLAEETGLIVRIGEWALRTACHEAARWRQQDGQAPLFVSVNLSPRQLSDIHLLSRIQSALDESGLAPERLELELTESILADQSSQAVQVLMRIAELGVRLVLDDFGTGYSSLSYLKHFPIAKLKIDRGFVHELPGNLDDKSICDAVIGLGRSLDVTVLAEGIETREQAELLERMGCQQAQGFFFARPLPASTFREIAA